jgi:hypothetical protein
MTKIICIMCVMLMIVGCTGRDGTFDWRKPMSLDLTPPEGPYEYEEGWTDGCESGMHTYTDDFYKTIGVGSLRSNPELRSNKMYYQAWKDAYLYCAVFMETVKNDTL